MQLFSSVDLQRLAQETMFFTPSCRICSFPHYLFPYYLLFLTFPLFLLFFFVFGFPGSRSSDQKTFPGSRFSRLPCFTHSCVFVVVLCRSFPFPVLCVCLSFSLCFSFPVSLFVRDNALLFHHPCCTRPLDSSRTQLALLTSHHPGRHTGGSR